MKKFSLITLLLALLACNLPTVSGPTPPPDAPRPDEADLVSAREKLEEASETFTLTLTEDELTALANQRESTTFQDVVLVLDDGQVQAYGLVNLETVQSRGRIVFEPSITEDGTVNVRVISAEMGPIAVNEALIDTLQTAVDDALESALGDTPGLQLVSLSIDDGVMTIEGRR